MTAEHARVRPIGRGPKEATGWPAGVMAGVRDRGAAYAALCCAVMLLACGRATGPEAALLGTYRATVLVLVDRGDTTDFLAAGGGLSMELRSGGDARVELALPGGASTGGDIDTTFRTTWQSNRWLLETGETITTVQLRRIQGGEPAFLFSLGWTVDGDMLWMEAMQCGFDLLAEQDPDCVFRIELGRAA